jgi:hypothetical protein
MAKVATQPAPLAGSHEQAVELIAKYRDLSENKRDLKRKLKKFDEDFLSQHHRAPKKSDKEVIRPMYQKYHEVRWLLLKLLLLLVVLICFTDCCCCLV